MDNPGFTKEYGGEENHIEYVARKKKKRKMRSRNGEKIR